MNSVAIRSIIVDDEQKSRKILRTMLHKYCPQVQILGEATSSDHAHQLIVQQQPNLIFLDVEMPNGSGFDLLKGLPGFNFEIIFVTGFDFYALQAIKFHALDFLLKPVDIEELIQAVQRTQQVLQTRQNNERLRQLLKSLNNTNQPFKQLAIPTLEGRVFIPVKEVVRCQADGGCTWFYLADGQRVLSSKNLGEYEKLLPGVKASLAEQIFFRVHYGHLINLQYIRELNRKDGYVEMKDQAKIPIAQRRKTPFLELLRQQHLF